MWERPQDESSATGHTRNHRPQIKEEAMEEHAGTLRPQVNEGENGVATGTERGDAATSQHAKRRTTKCSHRRQPACRPCSLQCSRDIEAQALGSKECDHLVSDVVASVDELLYSPLFALSFAYMLEIPTGWNNNKSQPFVFPEDPCEWTLKHLNHNGELQHVGVSKDPTNRVY